MIGSVLSRPVAGKTVVVGSDGHDEIDLLFALRDVECIRQGDDLVFRFPDGAGIVLEHYFALPPKSRPVFFGNDQKPIPASVLAKAAADIPPAPPAPEEIPGEGPAVPAPEQPDSPEADPRSAQSPYGEDSAPQAGKAEPQLFRSVSADSASEVRFRQSDDASEDKGGRYHEFENAALTPGVDRLDGLDLGWARAFAPERLPYEGWKWTDSAASGRVEPLSPGFAVPDGSVTEEAEGTFAGSVGINSAELSGGVFVWPEPPRYGAFTGGADGRFSYVLDNDLPSVQSLAEGESVREVIRFVYRVGGKETIGELVVTIRGTNDAPKITNVSRLELEADGVKEQGEDPNAAYSGATHIAGTVSAGDVDSDDTAETLQYTFANGQRALRMAFGNLSIDASGRYVYTLDDRAKALAQGEERIERVEVLVTDRHGATDTATVEIVVRGTNDRPTLELGKPELALAAQTGDLSAVTSEGKIARTDDADDGHSLTIGLGAGDGPAIYLSGQPVALNGRYGFLMLRPDGSYAYTLNRNAEGDTVDASVALSAGETGEDIFYIYVKDEHGAWSRQEVAVRVAGANEPPVIDAGASTVFAEVKESGVQDGGNADTTDWTGGGLAPDGAAHKLTATGKIAASDADENDTLTFTSSGGKYGTVTFAPDGTYIYTLKDDAAVNGLAQGESLTDTFEVSVSDGHGGEAKQAVAVTIHGTNDRPELVLGYDGGATVQEDAAQATATGTFSVKDADNDAGEKQTFGVSGGNRTEGGTYQEQNAVNKPGTANDAKGVYETDYGRLELDPATGKWTYTLDNAKPKTQALGEGETATETFTVTVTDEHGAMSEQTLTVTLKGSNDAPTIDATGTTFSAEVKESGVQGGGNADTTDWTGGGIAPDGAAHKLTAMGTIKVNDVDAGDTHSFTATDGTYGTVTIGADGTYIYTLTDGNPAINALKQGESVEDTFTIMVDDGHGGKVEQEVKVTIHGTNDRPTIAGSALSDAEAATLDKGYPDQQTAYSDTASIAGNTTTLSGIKEEGFKNGVAVKGNDVIHGKVKIDDVDSDDDPSSLHLGASASGGDPDKAQFVVSGGSVTIKGTYGDLILRADGTYTYKLDNTRAATDNLTDADHVSDTFTVYVKDAHGAWAEHAVVVKIEGTTEDIHIDAGGYTHEATEAGVVGGSFDGGTPDGGVKPGNNAAVAVPECKGAIDVSGVEGVPLTYTVNGIPVMGDKTVITTANGELTFNLDGTYSFKVTNNALNAGEKVTDKVTVTVDTGGVSGTASLELTFNITGTNDMPTLELNAPNVAFDQSVNTTVPAIAGGGSFSGTVTSSDPDKDDGVSDPFNSGLHYKILPVAADQHKTLVTESGGTITAVTKFGTLTFDTADGSYTYTLNTQEFGTGSPIDWKDLPKDYKDTFTFRVIDSHGSYVDKVLSVPLNGTNDVPTFSSGVAFTPLEVWEDGTTTSGKPIEDGGKVGADDADDGENPTYGFLVDGKFVDYYTVFIGGKAVGTMYMNADGTYSFTVDNSSTLVQSLYKWDGADAAYGDPNVTDPNCIKFDVTIVARDKWSDAGNDTTYAHETIGVTIKGQHDAPKFTHEEGAGYTHTLVEAGVDVENGSMSAVDGTPSVSGKVSASDADINDGPDTIKYSLITSGKDCFDIHGNTLAPAGTAGASAIAGTNLEVVVGKYGYLVFDTDSQEYAYFLLNETPAGAPELAGALGASIKDHWSAIWNAISGSLNTAKNALDALAGGTNDAIDEIWVFAWDKASHVTGQQLSFNVSGTNDKPTLSGPVKHELQIGTDFSDVSPGSASLPVSGTHTVDGSDVDAGDKLIYSLVDAGGSLVQIVEGTYGYLTLKPDGSYFYTLNARADNVTGLSHGESVTESFNVRVTDSFGAYADSTITIALKGRNEQGTLAATKGTVKEDDANGALPDTDHPEDDWTTTGDVSISGDPDKNDTYYFSLSDTQGGVGAVYCYYVGIGVDDKPVFEYSTTFDGAKTLLGTLKLGALSGEKVSYTFTFNHEANKLDFIQKLGIKGEILLGGFNVYAKTYAGGTEVPGGGYAGNIPIVIQGTDDNPVVNNGHANLICTVKEDADLVAGKDLTFGEEGTGAVIHDIDNVAGDISCYFGTPGMLSWTGQWGTLILYRNDGTGQWSYKYYLDSVKVKEVADFKGAEDTFTVTVDDGAGGKATLEITAKVEANSDSGDTGFIVNVANTQDTVAEDDGADPDNPALQIVKTGYVAESIEFGGVMYTLVKEGADEGKYLAHDGTELTGRGFYFYIVDGSGKHVQSVSDEYGSLVIDSRTGKWTYTLNNSSEIVQGMRGDEEHTLNFTIGVGNGTANPTNATISVTIKGTDDLQSITGGDSLSVKQTYDADNVLVVEGGKAELKVEDADIVSGTGESAVHEGPFAFWFWMGGVQVSEYVVMKDGLTYGTITMDSVTGEYTFTFAADAPHIVKGTSLTFDDIPIRIINSSNGIPLDSKLALTLTGTNVGPESFIFSTSGGALAGTVTGDGTGNLIIVQEDGGNSILSGGISGVKDGDGIAETFTYSVGGKTLAAGKYGSFVIDPETGKYSYTLNNDLAEVQKLGKDDTRTEVFSVTVTDSSGASVTQDIAITVQGTNDAPVLAAGLPLHVTHDPKFADTEGSNHAEGLLGVKDVDSPPDSLLYSVGDEVKAVSGLTQDALSCYVLWDGNAVSYSDTLLPEQADKLLGTFSFDRAGNTYSFDLAKDSLAVRSLADGELKEFSVNINVSDGTDVASSQVKVQITGTNDGPELLYGDGAADGQSFTIDASSDHLLFSAAGHTHDNDMDQGALRNLIDPDAKADELIFSFSETPPGSTLLGTTKLEIKGCGTLTLDDKTGLITFERTGDGAWDGKLTVAVTDRHTADKHLTDTQELHFQIGGATVALSESLPDMSDLLARDSGAEAPRQSFMACLFETPQEGADGLAADAALPVPGYTEDQLAAHVNMLMSLNG